MNTVHTIVNLAWVEVDGTTGTRWSVLLPTAASPDWVLRHRNRLGYPENVDWTPPQNWCILSTEKEID